MVRSLVWYVFLGSFVIFGFIEWLRYVPISPSGDIVFRIPYTYCLPSRVKFSRSFSIDDGTGIAVSVKRKLDELGAQCTITGNLIDEHGREIAFYPLRDCFPRRGKEDIKEAQDVDMNRLRAKYSVVPITCMHVRR